MPGDSDIVFDPDDIDRLRAHGLPLVAGLYAKKNQRGMANTFLRTTTEVEFGEGGGLLEIQFAGFGFTLTHKVLYDTMYDRLRLPICNQRFERTLVPFFAPTAIKDGDSGEWYLAEDYSFCVRARSLGVPIMADTRVRLWHVGSYYFGWEDAGSAKERYRGYTFRRQTGVG